MKKVMSTLLMIGFLSLALAAVGCAQTGSDNMSGNNMDKPMESMSGDTMDKNMNKGMDTMDTEKMDGSMEKGMDTMDAEKMDEGMKKNMGNDMK